MIDLRFQPMQERPKARPGRPYQRANFSKNVGAGYDDLERELRHLKATDIVVESGHDRADIRNDGWPRSSASPAHHDVRLFFKCKHGALRYECNNFDDWRANLRAIGLWLQRQRLAIEEWGIGTGGEAYRGFAALPPAGGATITLHEWANAEEAARFLLQTEGCAVDDDGIQAVLADPTDSYREAARVAHPDAGGSTELMAKVNRARDYIKAAMVANGAHP